MKISYIFLIFAAIFLLLYLAKKFPQKFGRYIFFWVGPKPQEGLSSKTYFLIWAKVCFVFSIALIIFFISLGTVMEKKNIDILELPILAAFLFFALPIFIVIGIIRLFESLVKAYIYRDKKITLIHTIYLPLLNEGTDVWRPVEAKHIEGNIYKIISKNETESDEEWMFSTGDYVRCEEKKFQDKQKSSLAAVEKIEFSEVNS